jgi:membrane-bound lytic murein transglycosylase A
MAETADPVRRTAGLQQEFMLLRSAGRDGRGEVLITGYYEPVLVARRVPEPPFIHPVYGVPDDLVTVSNASRTESHAIGRFVGGELVPYPDRATIDRGEGVPEGTAVLGWVADRVDLFFLHVQGSGTLVFENGERLRAGFAASNGRDYVSIGRQLIDEGAVAASEMSMQAIRGWLADHPGEVDRVLWSNPRYVFFRPLPTDDGPLGCYGTPLVAGRSIATDRRVFPAPVPALLTGTLPAAGGDDQPVSRLVVIQDTGSSIIGPGRVDLFFGTGDAAGDLAGRTKHLGELFILLPR